MGGGGDSGATDAANRSNDLLQKQLDIQRQQYKDQLQALSEKEFNIIKTKGGLNWDSGAPTGVNPVE